MVEVIGPGAVASVSTTRLGAHHTWIVEPALGDHQSVPADLVYPPRYRFDDVLCAGVEDGMYGIQPQSVDTEVPDPPSRALEHPFAHWIAVGLVVVDRASPGRVVHVGEVRPVGVKRLHAGGADVVVNHIQDDR